MKISDFQIHDTENLDHFLVQLVEMIIGSHQNNPEGFGMVAAGVLDNQNRFVPALNHILADTGKRVHAERAAIEKYKTMHGEIEPGSIIITTLSPCIEDMDERSGDSCDALINLGSIHKVYCGYRDPTQEPNPHKTYHLQCTKNKKLELLCKRIADTFLKDHEDK
jgi:pyrimidine deaminase RibD-like protein